MGIYVKDMEMPKSCFECDLYNDESNFCKAQKEYMPFALFGRDYKSANCPLVEVSEPHGDLIDRDEVRNDVFRHLSIKGEENLLPAEKSIFGNLIKAKAVVKAEGE